MSAQKKKQQISGTTDPAVRKKSKTTKPQTTADNYIDKELSRPGQDYDMLRVQSAKRILDDNVHYLSKECYLRLNQDIVQNRNPETIRVLLAFKNHASVDLLIRNCMLLFNEHEYNRMVNKSSNSPIRPRSS